MMAGQRIGKGRFAPRLRKSPMALIGGVDHSRHAGLDPASIDAGSSDLMPDSRPSERMNAGSRPA
jgi:hypothetical protein